MSSPAVVNPDVSDEELYQRRLAWCTRVKADKRVQKAGIRVPDPRYPQIPEEFNRMELALWRATKGDKTLRADYDSWFFYMSPSAAMWADKRTKVAAAAIYRSISKNGLVRPGYMCGAR